MVSVVNYFSSTDYSSWNTHIIFKPFSFIQQANSNAYSTTSPYKKFWLRIGHITFPLYSENCGNSYCRTECLGDSSAHSTGIHRASNECKPYIRCCGPCSWHPLLLFYINALNKTWHFGSLQQIKFMPINLTLRFPPNRDLWYYCSSELYFCLTSCTILLPEVFA